MFFLLQLVKWNSGISAGVQSVISNFLGDNVILKTHITGEKISNISQMSLAKYLNRGDDDKRKVNVVSMKPCKLSQYVCCGLSEICTF